MSFADLYPEDPRAATCGPSALGLAPVTALSAPRANANSRPALPSRHPTALRRQARPGSINLAKHTPDQALALTLRELAELYEAKHPDKRVLMLGIRKWLDDFQLGEVSAWALTREQLRAGAKAMKQQFGYKAATINRNIGQIGTLYRWAIKEEITPAGFSSPTIGAGREAEEPRVVEPARPSEWENIRRTARTFADQRFTLLVWLIMDTGARRAEIAERTWADFDLDAPEGPHVVLQALDVKTKRARRLYFSQETAQLVRRLRPAEKYRQALAFVGRSGSAPNQYRKSWARLTEMIGRPELRVNDLRHMVAADLLKAGKGMSQVAQLLGHSSLVLHRRYGHLDDAGVREIQTERLGLDKEPPPILQAVADAKIRHEQRTMSAADDMLAEAQRLQLVAQEAMAAAMAAAQALAGMRAPSAGGRPQPAPLELNRQIEVQQ